MKKKEPRAKHKMRIAMKAAWWFNEMTGGGIIIRKK